MNKKKWIILVVALLLVAALVWFFFFRGGETVATVDGISITADDISFRIRDAENALWPEYFEMFPDHTDFDYDVEFRDGLTFAEAVRQEAVRMAAVEALILREARRLNTDSLSREERDHVSDHIAQTRDHFNEMEPGGFETALREAGFRNENHWRDLLDNQRIMQNTIMAIMESPEELARLAPYMPAAEGTELLGAKHILAAFANFETEEEAEAFANDILARINAGEDFVALMNEYSQDPGLMSFPDGYTFGPNEMVPEFEQGTRALAIGEISGLVRSSHGFHIIMRIEPDPDQMMNQGGNEEMQAIFEAFEEMARRADIVFRSALNNVRVGPVDADEPEEEEEE